MAAKAVRSKFTLALERAAIGFVVGVIPAQLSLKYDQIKTVHQGKERNLDWLFFLIFSQSSIQGIKRK